MSKITAFIDSVGRVIVGQAVKSQSKTVVKIKEPAVVNVQVNQENGQISVQLLPFLFREFVKPEVQKDGVVWDFNKSTIVTSENLDLEENIINQYKNIFQRDPAPAPTENPEVVKLFDE